MMIGHYQKKTNNLALTYLQMIAMISYKSIIFLVQQNLFGSLMIVC